MISNVKSMIKNLIKDYGLYLIILVVFTSGIVYSLFYLWITTPSIYPAAIAYLTPFLIAFFLKKTEQKYPTISNKAKQYLVGFRKYVENMFGNSPLGALLSSVFLTAIVGIPLLILFVAIAHTTYDFISPLFPATSNEENIIKLIY